MLRAVIYARYSSSSQTEASIERQIMDCTEYAKRRNYTIINQYIDRACTGTNARRKSFQQMISDAAEHRFDIVICWKIDRFARKRIDSANYKKLLRDNNVRIEYAAEPLPEGAMGVFYEGSMEAYAEFYSVELSEKIKASNYVHALNHETLGQELLGLKRGADKKFEIDEQTAPYVRYVFDEVIKGTPFAHIVKHLNSLGVKTPHKNKPLSQMSVQRIVRNEKYKGTYKFSDKIYDEDIIPKIVSKEIWKQANDMLDNQQAKMHHTDKREIPYLLTGKIICGDCGSNLRGYCGKVKKDGFRYSYYQCRKRQEHSCTAQPIPKEYIEDKVIDTIWAWLHDERELNNYAEQLYRFQFGTEDTDMLDRYKAELKDAKKGMTNIVDYIIEHGGNDVIAKKEKALTAKIEQLERTIAELECEITFYSKDDFIEAIKDMRDNNYPTSPEQKEKMITDFVYRVIAYDGYCDVYFNSKNSCTKHIDLDRERLLNSPSAGSRNSFTDTDRNSPMQSSQSTLNAKNPTSPAKAEKLGFLSNGGGEGNLCSPYFIRIYI